MLKLNSYWLIISSKITMCSSTFWPPDAATVHCIYRFFGKTVRKKLLTTVYLLLVAFHQSAALGLNYVYFFIAIQLRFIRNTAMEVLWVSKWIPGIDESVSTRLNQSGNYYKWIKYYWFACRLKSLYSWAHIDVGCLSTRH